MWIQYQIPTAAQISVWHQIVKKNQPHPPIPTNDKISSESIGVSQTWSCIFSGNCVYSGGDSRHSWNFDLSFCLEGQGQSLHRTVESFTKVLYTCVANLVSLVWMGDELLCAQIHDWCTHGQTGAGNENTWRLKVALSKIGPLISKS